MFAAARDLEAAYARAGYVLVRVILPPQQLVNGARLKLIVVDGFIERVETRDVPERVRKRIETLVGPLAGRRGLTLTEIERRVLLAGDTPGVILRSTLEPGKVEGAAVLVIDGKYQAVSETLTFDNTLSNALGRTTLGAGLDFNSVAGLGELVYLRAAGHPEGGDNGFFDRYPRNRVLAAGFVLPLWVDGLPSTPNTPTRGPRRWRSRERRPPTPSSACRCGCAMPGCAGGPPTSTASCRSTPRDETQSLFVASVPAPLSQDRLRIVRLINDGEI